MADRTCRNQIWPHCCGAGLRYRTPSRVGYFEPRRFRRGTILIKTLSGDLEDLPTAVKLAKKQRARTAPTGKLAVSREQAKRFFRSVISNNSQRDRSLSPGSEKSKDSSRKRRPSPLGRDTGGLARHTSHGMRTGIRGSISGPVGGIIPRPSLAEDVRHTTDSTGRPRSASNVIPSTDSSDKPLASGSGVQVSINLAEPVLFLQGFDQADSSQGNTAMLRGTLHLRVQKSAKIKAVTLKFKGRAVTKWPEGKFQNYIMSTVRC